MAPPATAPTRDGSASIADPVGRVTAATIPSRPNPVRPINPMLRLRTDAIPSRAATIASTTPIPISSTVLSLEPKVRIAKLFSHSGVRSIAVEPTAITGEASRPTKPATRWATAMATAAESSPMTAPRNRYRSVGRSDGAGMGADASVEGFTAPIRPRTLPG